MAGFRAPGLLRIPQWSIVNRLVTAQDISFDINGVETARVRTNLDNGVVYLTVRDASGTIVLQKDSTNSAEIEHKNQLIAELEGQATIKFVEADTAPLQAGAVYWFDVWVKHSDGREEPIVDSGRFYVDVSQTHISEGPAPSLPTFPASQTPQFQNFKWTATAVITAHTVTIPNGGMVDATYTVTATLNTIAGGTFPLVAAPDSARTATTFPITTSAALTVGDTIDFQVRDSS